MGAMHLSNVFPSSSKLLIVSHDAGGAEILSSLVKHISNSVEFVLEGPAVNVFNRKLGKIANSNLHDALSACDIVLCGTSWQSDIEYNAIVGARKLNKKSYSFIDHWINYPERFERSSVIALPDTICVGDEYALRIAQEAFETTPVILIENPYFEEIRVDCLNIVRNVPLRDKVNALYVCSPIKEHALMRFNNERHWGYVEEDALKYFLDNLSVFHPPIDEIVIRLHPSEAVNKYENILNSFSLPIRLGRDRSLIEEIAHSDVVVGCQTMALVVALIAGKQAVSSIPPSGDECALPQSQIIKLKNVLKSGKVLCVRE